MSFKENYRAAHEFNRKHPKNAPIIELGSKADKVCDRIVTVMAYCVGFLGALFIGNVCIQTVLNHILGA